MNKLQALMCGVVGASALTVLNETARQVIPHAPRMEVIGMRGLAKSMRAVDAQPPRGDDLYRLSIVGDLLSNAVYYSLVAAAPRDELWRRGVLLGGGAGIGAAFLPAPLGLGHQPHQRFPETHFMTVAWYLVGGLVTAAIARRFAAS